jgi:chromosome segregation ATPase
MTFSETCNKIFIETTEHYHEFDNVDATPNNPYSQGTIEDLLFKKNWIDAVQWHLEDIIRDPQIQPNEALKIKRRIDKSNQDRTDLVESIDDYFLDKYSDVKVLPDATINTESPAWAIDRLSILALKIYHMEQEVKRTDASPEHLEKCNMKLSVLLQQREDLSTAIDQLIEDIEAGRKYMKTYKQMKMYNDPALNPVLYKNKK